MTQRVNDAGLAILKEFEQGPGGGVALKAYRCSAGVWTIGWGSTRGVTEGMRITVVGAEDRLMDDIAWAEKVVGEAVIAANENEFAACVLLAFNVGAAGFRKSSVVRLHNAGDKEGAARAFLMWDKVKNPKTGRLEPSNGLIRRRTAEMGLYLKPVGALARTVIEPLPQAVEAEPSILSSKTIGSAIATGGLIGAQQTITQVEGIWNSLRGFGVNPHILLAALGIAAVGLLAYVIIERLRKRRAGIA